VTPKGFSALSWATYLTPEVTQALLAGGAPVDQPLGDGRTAVWEAACRGNIGAVKLLLAAGADPRVRSGGLSAVDCARRGRETAPALRGQWLFAQDFDAVVVELAAARRPR